MLSPLIMFIPHVICWVFTWNRYLSHIHLLSFRAVTEHEVYLNEFLCAVLGSVQKGKMVSQYLGLTFTKPALYILVETRIRLTFPSGPPYDLNFERARLLIMHRRRRCTMRILFSTSSSRTRLHLPLFVYCNDWYCAMSALPSASWTVIIAREVMAPLNRWRWMIKRWCWIPSLALVCQSSGIQR
jgi:hypothetical protein